MPASSSSSSIRVLAVDLVEGGHHGQQARQTAEAVLRYAPERLHLTLAVPPSIIAQQPRLRTLVAEYPERFTLHAEPAPPLEQDGHVWARNFRNGTTHAARYRALAREHDADHLLLPYLDMVWPNMAARRAVTSVPITGMYFHPGFHYALPDRSASAKRWANALVLKTQKTLVARSALRYPALRALCCIDPHAVPALRRWAPRGVHVDVMPDGTEHHPPPPEAIAETRASWALEPGRMAWLCFGALNERKGVHLVLEALQSLSPEAQRRLAIVLAGRPNEPERLKALVEAARATTAVQIVTRFGFIPEDAIERTIAAADGVLAPYVRHVGASGFVIRAAQAERPSIGPEYGLVGRYFREFRLGPAVPTEGPGAPAALSRALERALLTPEALPFDRGDATRFAALHTVERFGRIVVATLLDGLGLPEEAEALRAEVDTLALSPHLP